MHKLKSLFLLFPMALVSVFFMISNMIVCAETEEEMLLSMVNTVRVESGLGKLSMDVSLTEAAKIRAKEASVSFSHIRPDGTDYYTVSNSVYGENLAMANNYNTLEEVCSEWMASPSHRANILCSTSTKTGFSVYRADNGMYYVAEEFN